MASPSLLFQAVEAVLTDDSFDIGTAQADNSRQAAQHLLQWIPKHKKESETFETELTESLSKCLDHGKPTVKVNREAMWSAYHSLRTSEPYLGGWRVFLKQASIAESSSSFCQYVGHHIFKQLIKQYYYLGEEEEVGAHRGSALTTEETLGLRYSAGYIPRALKKKLTKSSHPLKDHLQLCLFDLLDEGDDSVSASSAWVDEVNRGGLTKVNNTTFDLFLAMEYELRTHIRVHMFSENISQHIIENDNVQFYWSILSADWEEECSEALLEMIVSQWVKIRGFSYAGAWVERYKAEQKITTQKSKGVRKQLLPKTKEK